MKKRKTVPAAAEATTNGKHEAAPAAVGTNGNAEEGDEEGGEEEELDAEEEDEADPEEEEEVEEDEADDVADLKSKVKIADAPAVAAEAPAVTAGGDEE